MLPYIAYMDPMGYEGYRISPEKCKFTREIHAISPLGVSWATPNIDESTETPFFGSHGGLHGGRLC